jgi:hypothetical protein
MAAWRYAHFLSFSLFWVPRALLAQGDCFPAKDSHEAQLFAALAVPLAFSVVQAPDTVRSGRLDIGLEVTYLPGISEEIRTPTTCRPGKGPENTDLLFAIPRPRISLSLPLGLMLEGSWVPPVRLNGVKANLIGVSLQRAFQLPRAAAVIALRIHGSGGLIRAPVVCNDDALEDPTSECFQGTRSDDRYHPNTFGAEAAVSWGLGNGQVRPFVGGGVNLLHPRFQVHFTNQFGSTDTRKVEVDLTRGALFGGASWQPSTRVRLSGEVYGSPGDAVTGRVLLNYAIQLQR